MDMPAAEVRIDAELVTRLVRAQHPDLAGPVTPVSNGWDNALYRLGSWIPDHRRWTNSGRTTAPP